MSKKIKKDTFVQGTMIAYLAIIITKVMGALYSIPFYAIIGEEGGVTTPVPTTYITFF